MRVFRKFAIGLGLFAPWIASADFEARVFRYEWPQPVSIEAVLSIPQLRRAVNEFGESADARLIIRYPGGDAGNNWAIEVRNTLIGLGVPGADISVEPASGEPDSIQILVVFSRVPS